MDGKSCQELAKLAENWWEMTHVDNLNQLEEVFKVDGKVGDNGFQVHCQNMRRAVRKCLILESLVVTITYTLFS